MMKQLRKMMIMEFDDWNSVCRGKDEKKEKVDEMKETLFWTVSINLLVLKQIAWYCLCFCF